MVLLVYNLIWARGGYLFAQCVAKSTRVQTLFLQSRRRRIGCLVPDGPEQDVRQRLSSWMVLEAESLHLSLICDPRMTPVERDGLAKI